jgi:cell division protein FtsW (lipid II flippase)
MSLLSRDNLRTLIGFDLTFRHAAWLTVGASLALSLLGIYMIDVGTSLHSMEGGVRAIASRPLVLKQIAFLLVSLLAGAAVAFPHYRYVRLLAWPAMWIVIGLLVFLLLPFVPHWLVTARNGARAWISFGPVDLQPGEIAKIAYVMVIADYFRYRSNHRTLLGLIPPALITLIPVALIMLEPDLGTALLFIPCLFAVLVAAGARLSHLAAAVLIAVAAGPAAFPLLKPHQKERIIGLINMIQGSPEGADDINYQSQTAKRLVGAGGLAGINETKSRALIHFNRLPECHNDMIFAIIINRFGFLGGLLVFGLYLLWFLGAFITAATCKDPFGRLVVIGCTTIVATQLYINIGMNLAMLPIIGLTLPYVSYGGSSMLTMWVMAGLIFSVAMRLPQRLSRPTFEFASDM